MMGSSAPPTPPQVAALALLGEIFDVLKNSEKAVAAHLADLRSAQADAEKAMGALAKAQAEHDARRAELDELAADLATRNAAFGEREAKLASMTKDLAAREAALKAQGVELATLANQVSGREDAIGKAEAEQTRRQTDTEAALKLQRAKAGNDGASIRQLAIRDADNTRHLAIEEADRMLAEARAAIEAERASFAAELNDQRTRADAALGEREKAVKAGETALTEARTALRAAMA